MTNHSIFNSSWTEMVFEGRNRDYGAYQLRRESNATTIKAMVLALLFVSGLIAVPEIAGLFKAPLVSLPAEPKLPEMGVVEAIMPPKPEPPKPKAATAAAVDNPTMDVNHSNPQVTTPVRATAVEFNTASGTSTDTGTDTSAPGTSGPTGPGTDATAATGGGPDNSPKDVSVLDRMPAYPGGIDMFRKEIGRKFNVPEDGLDGAGTMVVLVSFVIELDGTLTDVRVLRNPGHGLDKEALRVLKSMKKKWEPGSIGGQPVRTLYKLPIRLNAN